ncbi:MAG: hypothetical protein C0595_03355 [Marinilabiliales bacterium]|nr:MAG: hypothetical protein C0595_03355 [Marinilabiliales bacterium]
MWRLTFVIFLFIFSSCGSLSWKSPENKVAELEEVLEVSQASFHEIDTVWMYDSFDEINKNIEELKKLNINDSLPLFAEYKILKEALKEFMKARPVLGEELVFCKLQLINLKSDVGNGYLDEKEFESNFAIEKKAVHRISDKTEVFHSGLLKFKDKFNKSDSEFNSLINSLKHK